MKPLLWLRMSPPSGRLPQNIRPLLVRPKLRNGLKLLRRKPDRLGSHVSFHTPVLSQTVPIPTSETQTPQLNRPARRSRHPNIPPRTIGERSEKRLQAINRPPPKPKPPSRSKNRTREPNAPALRRRTRPAHLIRAPRKPRPRTDRRLRRTPHRKRNPQSHRPPRTQTKRRKPRSRPIPPQRLRRH